MLMCLRSCCTPRPILIHDSHAKKHERGRRSYYLGPRNNVYALDRKLDVILSAALDLGLDDDTLSTQKTYLAKAQQLHRRRLAQIAFRKDKHVLVKLQLTLTSTTDSLGIEPLNLIISFVTTSFLNIAP
jgi:hypothetical protein